MISLFQNLRKNSAVKRSIQKIFSSPHVTFPPNAPKFMILGAQKAGTTALYIYLAKHPEIVAAENKEPHFFDCPFRYSQGIEYYHSLFPYIDPKNPKITFDASGGYLANPSAYQKIYQYNPQLKLIVLLRNPIDRAFSAWNMYRELYKLNSNWFWDDWVKFCHGEGGESKFSRRKIEHFSSFDYVVKEEIEFLSQKQNTVLESPIITHGLYYEHISRYYSVFPPKNMLIIESDYFKQHIVDVLRKIERFIGLSPYHWEKENLSFIFEGKYISKISKHTKTLLYEFYKDSNEKLFNLIHQKFDWDE